MPMTNDTSNASPEAEVTSSSITTLSKKGSVFASQPIALDCFNSIIKIFQRASLQYLLSYRLLYSFPE